MVGIHTRELETGVAGLRLVHFHEAAALATMWVLADTDLTRGADVQADPVTGDGDAAGAVVADVADVVTPELLGVCGPGDTFAIFAFEPFRAVAVV